MKKATKFILIFACLLVIVSLLVACDNLGKGTTKTFSGITLVSKSVEYDGQEHELTITGTLPTGASVTYQNNKATEVGEYNVKATITADGYETLELTAKLTVIPTATGIAEARKKATEQDKQGYDFTLTISGNFNVLGLGASLNGIYDGAYRYDKEKEEVSFKRTTSGPLLFDSTAYVVTSGDNRIKLTMKDDKVKKVSIEVPEEQNITMVNLPVVALIDSIKAENISNIRKSGNAGYDYSCSVAFSSSNAAGKVLGTVMEKLGTGVSFKGIQLNASAGALDFNIKNQMINDFHFSAQMEIVVKSTKVAITLDYKQNGSTQAIAIPSNVDGKLLYTTSDIEKEVAKINAAIADIENDDVYSLDLTAKNEFDPGWNKNAIVDSYIARMYKNQEWFNHSFCYKAHSEKDGKESYKFTIGNVNGDADNQGTWIISRKSTNTQTKQEGVTAQTQFELLTSFVKLNANEIDCIESETVKNKVVYRVYMGKTGTQSVQAKILAMINSNPYDSDVIEVNNYFNTDNLIKDAYMEVVMEDNKLVSIECKTELKYTPTGGDWEEYNITLNNTIKMDVNKNLSKAEKYVTPTKVKGNVLGLGKNLNDSEYYIL